MRVVPCEVPAYCTLWCDIPVYVWPQKPPGHFYWWMIQRNTNLSVCSFACYITSTTHVFVLFFRLYHHCIFFFFFSHLYCVNCWYDPSFCVFSCACGTDKVLTMESYLDSSLLPQPLNRLLLSLCSACLNPRSSLQMDFFPLSALFVQHLPCMCQGLSVFILRPVLWNSQYWISALGELFCKTPGLKKRKPSQDQRLASCKFPEGVHLSILVLLQAIHGGFFWLVPGTINLTNHLVSGGSWLGLCF